MKSNLNNAWDGDPDRLSERLFAHIHAIRNSAHGLRHLTVEKALRYHLRVIRRENSLDKKNGDGEQEDGTYSRFLIPHARK